MSKGKKVRLGQMKCKRPKNEDDLSFEKILKDRKLGYLNYVLADVGVYVDISDMTKKQQLYLMNSLYDKGFFITHTKDKKFIQVVKLT